MALDGQTWSLIEQDRGRTQRRLDSISRELAALWLARWAGLDEQWMAALTAAAVADRVSPYWLRRDAGVRDALDATRAALAAAVTGSQAVTAGMLSHSLDDGVHAELRAIRSQLPEQRAMLVADPARAAIQRIEARCATQIVAQHRTLPAEQLAVVRQRLYRGVVAGENPREVARQITRSVRTGFEGGRWRAENIARTELLDAHRAASLASRMANAEVVSGWRWTATLSGRTCPACLAMDGKTFPIDTPGPHGHHSCRCVAVPLARSWRDLGIDVDEPPALDRPTGREWLATQPRAIQRQVLGVDRAAQLAAGRLDWDALPETRHTPGWRDSIHTTPLGRR